VEVAPLDPTIPVDVELMSDTGYKLAMHIVALQRQRGSITAATSDGEYDSHHQSHPHQALYIRDSDIPAEIVEAERARLWADESEKNDNARPKKKQTVEMLERIVNGRLHRFVVPMCLYLQDHMIEYEPVDAQGGGGGTPLMIGKLLRDRNIVLKRFTAMSIA
jgi:hypothetical protein